LAQENKRAQEKAAVEMELEQILLPVKQKTAALALDKMQFEVERQSLLLDKERTAYKPASRGLNGELSGVGQTNTSTNGVYQSKFGFGRSITATPATTGTPTAPRVVGSGVQPKGGT
jgi:hypothetical protein